MLNVASSKTATDEELAVAYRKAGRNLLTFILVKLGLMLAIRYAVTVAARRHDAKKLISL